MNQIRILDKQGKELPTVQEIKTIEQLATAYHGASYTDSDLATWLPSMLSADGDVLSEKGILDARSLDTTRNDGYIAGARDIHINSIVGDYFRLVAKPNYEYLQTIDKRFDEKWADEFKEAAEARFINYAESPKNWFDATRKQTFTEMTRTVYASYFDTGEAVAVGEWYTTDSPNKTAIRLINPARVCNPMGKTDDQYLRKGVVLNKRGAPVGYFIRESLPDRIASYRNTSYKWRYIPRNKPWGRTQVVHIFDVDRPEMNRAVSDLVSVLETIRSCKRFRKIQLQRAVLNSLYAATLESDLPSSEAFQMIGVDTTLADGTKSQTEVPWMNYYMSEVAKFYGAAGRIKLNDARIPHLPPGTKLKLNAANGVDAVGTEFEQSLLRYLAASLGLSYEQFARDFTQTNYSSARFASLDTWKGFASRRKFVPGKFGAAVYEMFLEEEMALQRLPMPAGRSIDFWDAPSAFSMCEFIGSGRGQIDEVKETQAAALRIAFNLSDHQTEIARLNGRDYKDVFRQRAKEKKFAEDLQLDTPTATVKGVQNGDNTEDKPRRKDGKFGNDENSNNEEEDEEEAFSELPTIIL